MAVPWICGRSLVSEARHWWWPWPSGPAPHARCSSTSRTRWTCQSPATVLLATPPARLSATRRPRQVSTPRLTEGRQARSTRAARPAPKARRPACKHRHRVGSVPWPSSSGPEQPRSRRNVRAPIRRATTMGSTRPSLLPQRAPAAATLPRESHARLRPCVSTRTRRATNLAAAPDPSILHRPARRSRPPGVEPTVATPTASRSGSASPAPGPRAALARRPARWTCSLRRGQTRFVSAARPQRRRPAAPDE